MSATDYDIVMVPLQAFVRLKIGNCIWNYFLNSCYENFS